MKIRAILDAKGSDVVTIRPDAPVPEAMRVLVQHNIGSLVVFEGELLGIITERDLLRAAAADPQRLGQASVRELMTTEVITVGPHAKIEDVMDTMTENRIRHLPIVEDGQLRGMISIGDVVNTLRKSVEAENRYLHAYIEGTPL